MSIEISRAKRVDTIKNKLKKSVTAQARVQARVQARATHIQGKEGTQSVFFPARYNFFNCTVKVLTVCI